MSYPSYLDIGRGIVRGLSALVKHGNNASVGATFVPIASGGKLFLPQPSGAMALRAVSTSADDASDGTGARTLLLIGLDAQGLEISETITMAGLTPSAFTTQEFWRLNFVDVVSSGTYGTATAGSHAGVITVSDVAAQDWAEIRVNGFPHSRWQSSWYTVPANKKLFSNGYRVGVESNKLTNVKVLARINALAGAAPYSPMTELTELTGVSRAIDVDLPVVFGPLPGGSDIGAIAQMQASTGRVSFDFDFIIEG